jgi:hypothetical protein
MRCFSELTFQVVIRTALKVPLDHGRFGDG